jgi:hypothetical protein
MLRRGVMLAALLALLLLCPASASAVELQAVGELPGGVAQVASSAVEATTAQVRTTVAQITEQSPVAAEPRLKQAESAAGKVLGAVPEPPTTMASPAPAPSSMGSTDDGAESSPDPAAGGAAELSPDPAASRGAGARADRAATATAARASNLQAGSGPRDTGSHAVAGSVPPGAAAGPAGASARHPLPSDVRDRPAPTDEPDAPIAGIDDSAGLSSAGFAVGFGGSAVLTTLIALCASGNRRRLAVLGDRWTTVPFVSALERPG